MTLLSNNKGTPDGYAIVSFPNEMTLLSNTIPVEVLDAEFRSLTK